MRHVRSGWRDVGGALGVAGALACASIAAGCSVLSGASDLTVDEAAGRGSRVDTPTNQAKSGDGGAARADASSADATQAQSTPGTVACGATSCSGSAAQCCVSGDGEKCVTQSASCSGVRFGCDERKDCPDDQVCCLSARKSVARCTPRAACDGQGDFVVCRGDGDCDADEKCLLDVENAGTRRACL
jgi:hypothetical protein